MDRPASKINARAVLFVIVLILAVAFIAIGVATHEYETVFGNAAMVCLECVGIG